MKCLFLIMLPFLLFGAFMGGDEYYTQSDPVEDFTVCKEFFKSKLEIALARSVQTSSSKNGPCVAPNPVSGSMTSDGVMQPRNQGQKAQPSVQTSLPKNAPYIVPDPVPDDMKSYGVMQPRNQGKKAQQSVQTSSPKNAPYIVPDPVSDDMKSYGALKPRNPIKKAQQSAQTASPEDVYYIFPENTPHKPHLMRVRPEARKSPALVQTRPTENQDCLVLEHVLQNSTRSLTPHSKSDAMLQTSSQKQKECHSAKWILPKNLESKGLKLAQFKCGTALAKEEMCQHELSIFQLELFDPYEDLKTKKRQFEAAIAAVNQLISFFENFYEIADNESLQSNLFWCWEKDRMKCTLPPKSELRHSISKTFVREQIEQVSADGSRVLGVAELQSSYVQDKVRECDAFFAKFSDELNQFYTAEQQERMMGFVNLGYVFPYFEKDTGGVVNACERMVKGLPVAKAASEAPVQKTLKEMAAIFVGRRMCQQQLQFILEQYSKACTTQKNMDHQFLQLKQRFDRLDAFFRRAYQMKHDDRFCVCVEPYIWLEREETYAATNDAGVKTFYTYVATNNAGPNTFCAQMLCKESGAEFSVLELSVMPYEAFWKKNDQTLKLLRKFKNAFRRYCERVQRAGCNAPSMTIESLSMYLNIASMLPYSPMSQDVKSTEEEWRKRVIAQDKSASVCDRYTSKWEQWQKDIKQVLSS